MAVAANRRVYAAEARSTGTFGRVECSCRDHHFISDGPVANGCPGEEVTPGELFLASIAACGVELMQVFAKEEGLPLQEIATSVSGEIDLANPLRPDVTLFTAVRLDFRLRGVTAEDGARLVERFKGR